MKKKEIGVRWMILLAVVVLMGGCANMGADSPKVFTGYWRSVEMNGAGFEKMYGMKLDLGENGKGAMVFLLKQGADEVHAVRWTRDVGVKGAEATGSVVSEDEKGGSFAMRVEGGTMVLSAKGAFARLARPEE